MGLLWYNATKDLKITVAALRRAERSLLWDMGIKIFGTRPSARSKSSRRWSMPSWPSRTITAPSPDEDLRAKTQGIQDRLAGGETLDDLLPEAFATMREAASRVLGLRPYRVQLIGGIVLHQGRIAEMKTGEGKTLVATLPAYLNALTGEGVHIVTVNDYLAKRDSNGWARSIASLVSPSA